jgi:hypothetical protein
MINSSLANRSPSRSRPEPDSSAVNGTDDPVSRHNALSSPAASGEARSMPSRGPRESRCGDTSVMSCVHACRSPSRSNSAPSASGFVRSPPSGRRGTTRPCSFAPAHRADHVRPVRFPTRRTPGPRRRSGARRRRRRGRSRAGSTPRCDPAARRRVPVNQAHAAAIPDEVAGGDQGVVSGADEDDVECRRCGHAR